MGDSRVSNHIPTLMMVGKIEFPHSVYLSEVSQFPVFSALSLRRRAGVELVVIDCKVNFAIMLSYMLCLCLFVYRIGTQQFSV